MTKMNDSLITVNEKYNYIIDKIDSIRANFHLIAAEELEAAMTELEKLEANLKRLEEQYPEELSSYTI